MAESKTKKKAGKLGGIDRALLEMVEDGLVGDDLAERITLRVLGDRAPDRPPPLSPAEIKAVRERARMSQAVFARHLDVTVGYVAKLEQGVRRPTGAALALLHVIRRKGIEAIL
jgi:putative transcriptional regulator